MKKPTTISHTEIETCKAGPRKWLNEKMSPGDGGRKIGYNQTLMGAIYKFHKTNSSKEARKHLTELLKRRDYKDVARVDRLEDYFDDYIKWFESSDVSTADHRVRVKYKRGYFELRGEVSRVDVLTGGGYRAVLLCDPPANWERQLRFPLLQSAIASKYGVPPEEVLVGIQELDGTGLKVRTFSSADLTRADKEFEELGETVKNLR